MLSGEPLYLDVVSTLKDKNIEIVGGRYGLSSKNTDPSQIYSVYKMLQEKLVNNFTIGIEDDVTYLSLPKNDYKIDLGGKELKIYGFGSDGMVSASKDILKIIGNDDNKYVQSYNEYDSKKSGGVTISHLRINDKPINAPYYSTNPDMVVITKDEYLFSLNMLEDIKDNGYLVINTREKDLDKFFPNKVKKTIMDKNLHLYTIDAFDIALKCNIKGKISKIMELVILSLLGENNIKEVLIESIKKQFGNKGEDIVNSNIKALDITMDSLNSIDISFNTKEEKNKEDNIFEKIRKREGDSLKVSDLIPYRDGTFPGSLTKDEKRKISTLVPKWDSDKCIQCNQCALVCPHAVIRPFAHKEEGKGVPMIGNNDYNFEMMISDYDCTSCGLCINTCPGKGGEKALSFGEVDDNKQERVNDYFNNYKNPEGLFPITNPKGLEFNKPCMEFSGACAGCGETPYIKLLTQLLGDKLVIANATGCSSIYGGSTPSTPYSIPWANSLFEDNAEFGFGMAVADRIRKEKIRKVIEDNIHLVPDKYKEIFASYYKRGSYESSLLLYEVIDDVNIKDLLPLKEYVKPKSFWMIGGDGWAYDIGFGGLDHVLSTNENVNILVLDTEVYSNTGGQSSKSSKVGSVAKFSAKGKHNNKKDLAKIALTYPHVYVATVSLGANMMQTIKAFNEAKNHNGPSIIIAYAPCIAQGIKGGMSNSIEAMDRYEYYEKLRDMYKKDDE